MKVISFLSVLSVLFTCLQFVKTQRAPYIVPQPVIEVFKPRGLRVSIPDEHGIRLLAFHGAVNRVLQFEEAGDLSEDVLKKQNGRWTYENRRLRLNTGDVINYWLYVIKNNLGYRLNDQSYTVTEYAEAPPGFFTKKDKTSTLYEVQNVNAAPSISLQEPAPPCDCAQSPDCPVYAYPEHQQNEFLSNLTTENSELRRKLQEIQDDKQYLIEKLQKDPNINKLVLTGKNYDKDSSLLYIESILREKLGLENFHIVKHASQFENNTLIFELNSLEDKLLVLRTSKDKLAHSKFKIIDYYL